MFPVIAQRTTTCYYCKDPIKPGEQRLTDVIKTRGSNENNNIPKLIKRHFHWRKDEQDISCYRQFLQQKEALSDQSVRFWGPKVLKVGCRQDDCFECQDIQ